MQALLPGQPPGRVRVFDPPDGPPLPVDFLLLSKLRYERLCEPEALWPPAELLVFWGCVGYIVLGPTKLWAVL